MAVPDKQIHEVNISKVFEKRYAIKEYLYMNFWQEQRCNIC